jgi:hypothetical protein
MRDDELERLVRRLRSLSPRAWASRRDVVRRLLDDLAALSAPGRRVPDLPDHALGDAVAVLGQDALSDPETRERAAHLVRGALDATR